MYIFIYSIIFITGLLFGSFFTLAIHRIPTGQNITNKRSYCPKCMHKLNFFDLIPILSYIFLKGRCRYCNSKIKIKYFLIEALTGIIFVLFAMSMKIDIYNMNIDQIISICIGLILITTLFIIGGIDKEKYMITKQVLLFGLILKISHIIYLYILNSNFNISIYKYIIYLTIILILLAIETILLKKKAKTNYTINILILFIYLAILRNRRKCYFICYNYINFNCN